jgi:hypothetical protein
MFLADNYYEFSGNNERITSHAEMEEVYHENEMQIMNATIALMRLEHEAIITNNMELLNEGIGDFFRGMVEKFKDMVRAIANWFLNLLTRFKNWLTGKTSSSGSDDSTIPEGLSDDERDKYKDQIKAINKDRDKYKDEIIKIFTDGASSGYYRDNYLHGSAKTRVETTYKAHTNEAQKKINKPDQFDPEKVASRPDASKAIKDYESSIEELKKDTTEFERIKSEEIQKFEIDILGTTSKAKGVRESNVETLFDMMVQIFKSTDSTKDTAIKDALKAAEMSVKEFDRAISKGGYRTSDNAYTASMKSKQDEYEQDSKANAERIKLLNLSKKVYGAVCKYCLNVCKHEVTMYKKYQDYDMKCRNHWGRKINAITVKEEESTNESYNWLSDDNGILNKYYI